MTQRYPDRWWKMAEGPEMARAVTDLALRLRDDYQGRETAHAIALQRYEGRAVGLSAREYIGGLEMIEARVPVAYQYERSLCETVQSHIASAQRPKAAFMTHGATWQERRRAKKLDRYCEGILRQPHGRYADAWELTEDAFLDAAIVGVGVVRVDADAEKRRVNLTRVPASELFCDLEESRYGDVRTLAHVYSADRDVLLELYPEHAGAIGSAVGAGTGRGIGRQQSDTMVEVVEVWRVRGKHCVALLDGSTLLQVEDWDHDSFPFAIMRYSPDRFGYWGSGLAQQVGALADATRDMADRMRDRIDLCSHRRVYYQEGSIDEKHLRETQSEVHIPFAPGAPPPMEVMGEAVSGSEMQVYEMHVRLMHDLTGVSEASTTARKEPGVNAAVAMREMNNVQSRRLQRTARAYEMFHVQLARAIVTVSAHHQDVVTQWPGRVLTRTIKWGDVSMAEDAFSVSVAPVSSLPNDPAGRLAMAQELMQAGAIDADTFKRLLAMPDLDREMGSKTAEYDYVADFLDRLLDADEDEAEAIYEPPDGFMLDVRSAAVQAGQAYFEARIAGAPEGNLAAVRRYCEDLNTIIQQQMAAAAPPPAMPPPGMPPAMGAPMAA